MLWPSELNRSSRNIVSSVGRVDSLLCQCVSVCVRELLWKLNKKNVVCVIPTTGKAVLSDPRPLGGGVGLLNQTAPAEPSPLYALCTTQTSVRLITAWSETRGPAPYPHRFRPPSEGLKTGDCSHTEYYTARQTDRETDRETDTNTHSVPG